MEIVETFRGVSKRDGRKVEFDRSRIKSAVSKAMEAGGEVDDIDTGANLVSRLVEGKLLDQQNLSPTVEEIQDVVEEILILEEFPKTAKHYILYRNERARLRDEKKEIPFVVQQMVDKSKTYLKSLFQEFIFFRTYSRWIDEEGRRETWIEAVARYMGYMRSKLGDKLNEEEYSEIEEYIVNLKALPSMRLIWSAGAAADATNACAYNCSYIAPTQLRDFGEILYLLMCGCGVGFSVEAHVTQQLPIVEYQKEVRKDYMVIEDSKAGWAEALNHGLTLWYKGEDVEFDFSMLRPAGAKLRTMGGRSSGPDPLIDLLRFVRSTVLANQGRRLTSLNVHDIICKIGEIVVMGGVRRSSEISLSDLDDLEMRDAKSGHFYLNDGHRQLANNSVAYKIKPSTTDFLSEWLSLAKSGTGERGIFNRSSLVQQIPSRRLRTIEDGLLTVGCNPCGEIILKSKQFCNLSEVIAREDDTLATLKKKIRIAAILGTYQSMLTDFPFLSEEWAKNCEQERLLGVSITGQWDSPESRKIDVQRWAKAIAADTNIEYAKRFGINPSMAVTCVKPSGTVSLLVNSSSGMHPRYSNFYIRRVRIAASDPLFQMIRDQKYPYKPEVGQTHETATTFVLEFPIKSPDGAITRNDITALQHLEYWKQVKENFTEHNPSCTIYVGEDEWLDVGQWVYKHWDLIGGLSFLPRSDHIYSMAPYEEITEMQYEDMVASLPDIDFAQIMVYEKDDTTEGSKEYACVGPSCEI